MFLAFSWLPERSGGLRVLLQACSPRPPLWGPVVSPACPQSLFLSSLGVAVVVQNPVGGVWSLACYKVAQVACGGISADLGSALPQKNLCSIRLLMGAGTVLNKMILFMCMPRTFRRFLAYWMPVVSSLTGSFWREACILHTHASIFPISMHGPLHRTVI